MKTSKTFDDCGVTVQPNGDGDIMRLPVAEIVGLFQENGLVLLTGFDLDTEVFERFTDQFSSHFMDHKGGGSLREVINEEGDRTILNVSYAYKPSKDEFDNKAQETFPLALHSDRSYTNSRPPLMCFYCVRPAESNGQTIVCDGIRLHDALSPSTRELFHENRIKYVRTYPDGQWQLWGQSDDLDDLRDYCMENDLAFRTNPDRSVTTEFVTSAVVKPLWNEHEAFVNSMLLVHWQEDTFKSTRSTVRLEDGSPIPDPVIAEIREVSEDLTHEVPWRAGDVVLLDNTRMLHGRRAFTDTRRTLYVRMARSVDW